MNIDNFKNPNPNPPTVWVHCDKIQEREIVRFLLIEENKILEVGYLYIWYQARCCLENNFFCQFESDFGTCQFTG